jgi:hypothetical protein
METIMKKALIWKIKQRIQKYRETIEKLENETGINPDIANSVIYNLNQKKSELFTIANILINHDINAEYDEYCKENNLNRFGEPIFD